MTRQGETTGFVLVPRRELEWIAIFADIRSKDDSKVFARVNHGALRTIRDKAAALAASPEQPASEATNLVPGNVWKEPEDDCWTSEVQVVGGHEVVATVHGATEMQAMMRRDLVLRACTEQPASEAEGGGLVDYEITSTPVVARKKADHDTQPAIAERSTRVDGDALDVIVHQLRASADIQTAAVRRKLNIPNATTDRAQLMRKAADTIEALAHPAESANCPVGGEAVATLLDDLIEGVAQLQLAAFSAGRGSTRAEDQGITFESFEAKARTLLILALAPAGAGDVGYARGVEDAARHVEGYPSPMDDLRLALIMRELATSIRALSARKDAAIEGGES